jgi:hypothetical protein
VAAFFGHDRAIGVYGTDNLQWIALFYSLA